MVIFNILILRIIHIIDLKVFKFLQVILKLLRVYKVIWNNYINILILLWIQNITNLLFIILHLLPFQWRLFDNFLLFTFILWKEFFDFRIKMLTVLKNRFLIILTISLNACFTDKKILFIDIIRLQNRIKMNIMKPILTFKALQHVKFLFINSFLIMGLFAVTVNIIEIITVFIKTVIIIFFIH